MTEPSSEVVAERLKALQTTMNEVRADVRDMKDGSPIRRIEALEQWRKDLGETNDQWKRALFTTMAGALVALVTAIIGMVATFL